MLDQLLDEFHTAAAVCLNGVSTETVERAASLLVNCEKCFVCGVGQTGTVARILSMKLNHVGLRAHTVYDEINPPFSPRDVLMCVSQSGQTDTILALAGKAKRIGGSLLAVTSHRASALGDLADQTIVVPPVSTAVHFSALAALGDRGERNLEGAVFGLNIYVLFYALVLTIARLRGESPQSIDARHTNME